MSIFNKLEHWNRTNLEDSFFNDNEMRNSERDTIIIQEDQLEDNEKHDLGKFLESKPELSKDKSLSSGASVTKANISINIFFSKAAIVILGDCLNQLLILDDIYSKYIENIEEIDNLEYIPLVNRFDYRQANYQNHYSYRTDNKNNNFYKLRKECKTLIHVIKQIIEELHSHFKFTKLVTFTCNNSLMKAEEDELLAVATDKKRYLKQLRTILLMEIKDSHKARERIESEINKLKNENEHFKNFENKKFLYSQEWQRAREEQNEYIYLAKEYNYQKTIDDTNAKVEYENRAHCEITQFIDELKQDQQNLIEHWMTTYDNKVEELDDGILKRKMDIESLNEKFEKLKEEYNEKQAKIDEYLKYKAQINAEKEYQMLRFYAAVKIQAWWRGVMVRKGLGPYKKKKKDKGKSKKNKKGKKDDKGKKEQPKKK